MLERLTIEQAAVANTAAATANGSIIQRRECEGVCVTPLDTQRRGRGGGRRRGRRRERRLFGRGVPLHDSLGGRSLSHWELVQWDEGSLGYVL